MPLTLSLAQPGDEKRIAQIHMAAFGPNAMHRAMFPTSAAEKGLEKILEKITAWEIGDPGTTILIVSEVRDRGEDGTEMKGDGDEKKIVAYAQWTHPERAVEGDEEGMGGEKDGGEGRDGGEEKEKLTYAKGTAHEVISAWRSKMAEAQRRVIGGRPCYCKSLLYLQRLNSSCIRRVTYRLIITGYMCSVSVRVSRQMQILALMKKKGDRARN